MIDRGWIWVFAEQREGRLLPVALELASEARSLAERAGMQLGALLFGQEVSSQCQDLFAHGVERVYLCEDATLAVFRSEPYATIIERLARQEKPEILLMGATSTGLDLAPVVAARLLTGLSADCTGLEIDQQGLLRQLVPAFGDRVMATILCPETRPQMATVRPGVFTRRPLDRHTGETVRIQADLAETEILVKVLEVCTVETEGIPLEEAEVVVAGGAGIGDRDGWRMIRELARSMNGAVGATRPPMDDGFATEGEMIGQSGKTARPKLYLGFGVSGEMQHTVGIRDARTIVAINKDPNAKIFQGADYGIVADYRDVLPRLLQAMKGE